MAVEDSLIREFETKFPSLSPELGPENLRRLLDVCSVVEMAPGRKLFRDRMPVDSLYLVLDGEMTVSIGDGRQKIELGKVGAGDWLGEVAVLSGELRASSTVTTDTPCRALRIHSREFENFVLFDEDIAYPLLDQLVALLSKRVRESAASESNITQSA